MQAFVFDMDGTLVDSIPGIGSALAEGFKSIGRTMPSTNLRDAVGPPIRVIAKRLDPTLTDDETLAIERVYRPLYDTTAWQETTLFAGVAQTLQTLHASGRDLFIVTNKPRIPTLKLLEYFDLQGIFLEALTRDSTTPHYASKAAMLADLISRQGLDPATTVMIGDTTEDRAAAEANHTAFVFVSYGYGVDADAAHRIDAMPDLLEVFHPAPVRNQ